MPHKTQQELFNLAWIGLKAQGFRRSYYKQSCRYRDPSGLKCAIGHSIEDENYSPSLENKGASAAVVMQAANISFDDAFFALDLQKCHDDNYLPVKMEQALRDFARQHNFAIPGEGETERQ